MSRADPRLIAGALIGSTAAGGGDKWSDLDLTFGLVDGVRIEDVLADWSVSLEKEFGAVYLFDLPYQTTTYRVFLLPSTLQVDLSFTPGKRILGQGLKHNILFGNPLDREQAKQLPPRHFFGLAVVFLFHARACIARDRIWEAEYCIGAARDETLSLACLRRGLKTTYGRGFDDLPRDSLKPFVGTLVRSLEKKELERALGRSVDLLMQNSEGVSELALRIEPQLRELESSQ